jgi:hypothetical protein
MTSSTGYQQSPKPKARRLTAYLPLDRRPSGPGGLAQPGACQLKGRITPGRRLQTAFRNRQIQPSEVTAAEVAGEVTR